jgi:hypothetical protein
MIISLTEKMRTSFLILMLLFSLTLSISGFKINAVNCQESESNLKFSWFTQNNVSIHYLYFGLQTNEANSISLYGYLSFQAIGNNSEIMLEIESDGKIDPKDGYAWVHFRIPFEIVNSHKKPALHTGERSRKIMAEIGDNRIVYKEDFTDYLQDAKKYHMFNETIDNIGCEGTISFYVSFSETVKNIDHKNFISAIFEGKGNLGTETLIHCDFEIPIEGEILEANLGDQEVLKASVPYRIDTKISVDPLDDYSEILYIEWKMPYEPPWWYVPPWSWLLSAILVVFLVSTLVTIATAYARRRFSKPKLAQE